MANHIRKQIRAAAVLALTGLSTTGANVFDSRKLALSNLDQLPCLIVRTEDEEIIAEETTLGGSAKVRRELELSIEAMVRATSGDEGQDTVDDIIAEVEVAIAANRKFSGLAKDTVLKVIETEIDDSGDQVFAAVQVVFATTYWTARGAPETAL